MTDTRPPRAARRRAAYWWAAACVAGVMSAANVVEAGGDWLRDRPHDIPSLWAALFATQAALFIEWARAAEREGRS